MSRIEWEMLLINIARLRDGFPVHFTATSSIAATFNYQVSAGVAGIYHDRVLRPQLQRCDDGGRESDPEYRPHPNGSSRSGCSRPRARRSSSCLSSKAGRSTWSCLMADGIEVLTPEGRFGWFILNWPTHPEEYEEFRWIASPWPG